MDKRFEVRKDTRVLPYIHKLMIKDFCVQTVWSEPEIIESFDNIEDARNFLSQFESSVIYHEWYFNGYYEITQYYIEEKVYDEDGNLKCHGNILEWTPVVTPD